MEDLEERLLLYWGPDFGPVTPLFPIDQAVSGPAVAADAQGNFVIVWTRQGTTSNSIMGRRFNPFGVPLSDKFEVVSGLNVDHAALAMDPAGDFAVTWQDGEIRARLFSAGGLPRTAVDMKPTSCPSASASRPTPSSRSKVAPNASTTVSPSAWSQICSIAGRSDTAAVRTMNSTAGCLGLCPAQVTVMRASPTGRSLPHSGQR